MSSERKLTLTRRTSGPASVRQPVCTGQYAPVFVRLHLDKLKAHDPRDDHE